MFLCGGRPASRELSRCLVLAEERLTLAPFQVRKKSALDRSTTWLSTPFAFRIVHLGAGSSLYTTFDFMAL
jgi:hypothetical protein